MNGRSCVATTGVFTEKCRLVPSEPPQPPSPPIGVGGVTLFANCNAAWHAAFWRSRRPHTKRQGPSTRPRALESSNPREGSRIRAWRSRWLSGSWRTRAKYARLPRTRDTPQKEVSFIGPGSWCGKCVQLRRAAASHSARLTPCMAPTIPHIHMVLHQ